MSAFADLLSSVATLLWVVLAAVALIYFKPLLHNRLTKLAVGPTGVSMEFAEEKLEQAMRTTATENKGAVGAAARRSVVERLQRNTDILATSDILWVDDHPLNNQPIVELLRRYGATVETPTTNEAALALLGASRFDVVISDVARDDEGPNSNLKGLELAGAVHRGWNMQILLFTGRLEPTTFPGQSAEARLDMTRRVQKSVFGRTNRMDELLHLTLDLLERFALR